MEKKTIIFIIILGVIVFFATSIIIMDGLTTKPSDIIPTRENEAIGESGSTGKKKYDVYKPNTNPDKKMDLQYAPKLEYKFTGQEPILDI